MDRVMINRLGEIQVEAKNLQSELRLRACEVTPTQAAYLNIAAQLIDWAWQMILNALRIDDDLDR